MKIVLDEGAIMPTKACETDEGFILYSREDKKVPAQGYAVFDTGVHIELPKTPFTVGFLKYKSGLITINVGYAESIRVKLYNHGKTAYAVNRGDKIGQLVIMQILTPELELVNHLDMTERGDGGFSSTGR